MMDYLDGSLRSNCLLICVLRKQRGLQWALLISKYIKGPTYSETLAKVVRDTMEKY